MIQSPKDAKTKSAKYKKIERITRRMFYFTSGLIIILAVLLLILSIELESEYIFEFGLTVSFTQMTEIILIIIFGVVSIFSRYKSRILAYIMM